MSDYRNMTEKELSELHFYFVSHEMHNANSELCDFERVYDKDVRVVRGRKVPVGTEGRVFWVKRFNNSKYGDPWGIYSTTRVGIKTATGATYFTSIDNIEVIE